MSKDQSYGFAVFIVSVIVAIVYLVAFFAPSVGLDPRWQYWAIGLPVLLFVLLVLAISGWIGWTMLTTPPPRSTRDRTHYSFGLKALRKHNYPETFQKLQKKEISSREKSAQRLITYFFATGHALSQSG
jgi:uncharacterized membrane protein YbhN (UPF0104 family)